MNSFANSTFTLLFGWARSLIQRVWTSAVTGQYSGFFTWLGDHWLWVVLFLCLGCTAMDFLIWLIRWRPYLVWRTRMRQWGRWLRGQRVRTDKTSRRQFERGYRDGVTLDLPQQEEPAQPREEWMPGEEWRQPAAWQPEEPATDAQEPETVLPDDAALQAQDSVRRRRFAPTADYELPPVEPAGWANSAYSTDLPAARRKRRSDKYDKNRASWREKLVRNRDDDEGMLDGLPPAVDRQQAFHEPVYPNQANPDGDAWQRPRVFKQAEGNRK